MSYEMMKVLQSLAKLQHISLTTVGEFARYSNSIKDSVSWSV